MPLQCSQPGVDPGFGQGVPEGQGSHGMLGRAQFIQYVEYLVNGTLQTMEHIVANWSDHRMQARSQNLQANLHLVKSASESCVNWASRSPLGMGPRPKILNPRLRGRVLWSRCWCPVMAPAPRFRRPVLHTDGLINCSATGDYQAVDPGLQCQKPGVVPQSQNTRFKRWFVGKFYTVVEPY